MSDFPEKENSVAEDGGSTVFSDPTIHKDGKVKSKKLLPKIIAGVLALCVLAGGTAAVIKFIPALEENENASTSESETVTVKALETDDISTVSVTNDSGVTELYSETEYETENTGSSEAQTTETVTWYTKQVDKSLTDSSAIESVVDAVANISATKEITKKTAAECGLDKAALKAVVTPKEEEKYTVLIGDASPDNTGYYLQLEGEEKIYLVSTDIYDSLQFDILDFASTDMISGVVNTDNEFDEYYTDGELTKFDRLVIKGNNFEDTVIIEPNTGGEISKLYNFLVVSPQKRLAENFDDFTTLFQNGLSPSGAYSYDVSAASLKKFGLDKPDIWAEMRLKNKTFIFKLTEQSDGSYAAIGTDSKMIYKVSPDYIGDIADIKSTDIYSSAIFMTHIDDIANFTVKVPDKEYSFDVSKNEADEDGEEPEEKYNVVINGKTLKSQNFQNYYGNCLGLDIIDFKTENVHNKPKISFVITNTDGTTTVVEFAYVTATRYQASVNGVPLGKITATSVDKIIDLTEDVANGKTVNY